MWKKFTKSILSVTLPAAIVIAAVIIGVVLVYTNQVKINKTNQGVLTSQTAGEKAIKYINENLLSQGTTASLVSVSEEDGVYKFKLNIGGNEYDSYVTKDGKLLFTSGISLEPTPTPSAAPNSSVTPSPAAQQTKASCEDLKKTGKALLEAFIVSNCPYGLQMQRILDEIVTNIPSLTENIKVAYIGSIQNGKITSMHGDNEAQENLRQICIREEQGDRYWDYVGCYIKAGDTDNCLTSANIDKTKLNSCMTDSNRGLKYAKADFDAQANYGVSGSPTLILNGETVSEFDFGGRTAEAVKTLLCCGFTTNIDVCSQNLTTDQAATSFSENYSSASGSSSSGGCQ